MNNKFITIFLIIFFINFINAIKISNDKKSLSSGLINILVDSNVKNVYPLNGECGNSTTFTCNNIVDAYNYGKSLGSYDQINFVLSDGIYNIAENSISIYDISVGIYSDSGKAIFDGSLNITGNPLITINNTTAEVAGVITQITIQQIQFINFSTSIVKATTVLSSVGLDVEQCIFNGFNTSISSTKVPMFDINSSATSSNTAKSSISFTDSQFISSNTYSAPLLKISYSTITFTNTNASQINSNNFLFSTNSKVVVSHGTFNDCSTSTGIFSIVNSNFQASQLSFNSNNATLSGSALTMISTVTSTYSCSFTQCQFNGGNSLQGGAVYFENNSTSPELMPSSFDACTFNNNSANLGGGALYITNVPVTIVNSNFQSSNVAGVMGGLIYVDQSSELSIQTTNLFTSGSDKTIEGVILYVTDSTVDVKNCTFDKFVGSGGGSGVYCFSSTINMSNNLNYTNSIVCSHCNVPGICELPSTTSTSGTAGGTSGTGNPFSISSTSIVTSTTGHTSNSNSINIFNNISSFIFIITITIFILLL